MVNPSGIFTALGEANSMVGENLSENTVKAYQREIRRFEVEFTRHFGRGPTAGDHPLIRKYIVEICPATLQTQPRIRIHFAAINHWLRKSQAGVLTDLPRSGNDSDQIRLLSPDEMQTLFQGTRNHTCGLMLKLLYMTGIRLNEIVSIRVEDVCFETKRIYLRGRGAKGDAIFLPPRLEMELHREIHGKKGSDYVFSLREPGRKPISTRTLQHFLTRSATHMRLGKITVQTLRDNFVVGLIEAGVHPAMIARIMGYKNQRALARYRKYFQGAKKFANRTMVFSGAFSEDSHVQSGINDRCQAPPQTRV